MEDKPIIDAASPGLTRRIGWVTLGRLAGISVLLLVNVILARNLPSADYGYYQQIWVLLNVAIPLFLFGLPVSINFFIPPLSGQERNNLMLQHVLLNLCMAFLFLGCVGGLGAAYRSTLFGIGPDIVPLLPIAAIGFGMIVCGFWEAFLIVYNKPKWLAISLVFFSLIHLSAVLLGYFIGKSLEWIFIGLSLSVMFRFIVVFLTLWRMLQPCSFRFRRDWLHKQLRYIWPVGLREGVGVLTKFSDKLLFILSASYFPYFNASTFAYYYNGAWELPVVGILVDSIFLVLQPELRGAYHRKDTRYIVSLMHFAARRIAFFIFPLAAFSFVVGPDLMSFLFGASYRVSGDYFRVFTLILLCRVSTAGLVLLAADRAGSVLFGTVLDLFIAVVVGFALIPLVGPFGPAIGLVCSTYCQVGYYMWKASRVLGTPLRDILPWSTLGKLVLVNGGIGVCSSFFLIFDSAVSNIIISGAVFGVLFLIGGMGLGWFEPEERDLLRTAREKTKTALTSLVKKEKGNFSQQNSRPRDK